MIIAKVMGAAVASVKVDALQATKLLVVSQADAQGSPTGAPFLAVDLIGAGDGELVMVCQGSTARMAVGNDRAPADAAIIGILDSLRYNGEMVFRKA